MLIKSCVNHYFSLSFLRKKTLKKYVDMFIENAVETAKIAVDSCYVLRQFLTPLPSIDFREIRGLVETLGLDYNLTGLCIHLYINQRSERRHDY